MPELRLLEHNPDPNSGAGRGSSSCQEFSVSISNPSFAFHPAHFRAAVFHRGLAAQSGFPAGWEEPGGIPQPKGTVKLWGLCWVRSARQSSPKFTCSGLGTNTCSIAGCKLKEEQENCFKNELQQGQVQRQVQSSRPLRVNLGFHNTV